MDYILSVKDLIVGPIYFFSVLLFAFYYAVNMPKRDAPLRTYFVWMIFMRLIGTITLAIIYQFYYKYGDTFFYYHGAIAYKNLILENPSQAIETFINTFGDSTGSTYLVMGFLDIFCFDSYIGIAILATTLNATGWWMVFLIFYRTYPQLLKQFAFALLFLPSVLIYGAGVLKEAPSILGMNMFLAGVYYFFLVKKRSFGLFLILGGAFLAYMIKAYLLISMLIACSVWVTFRLKTGHSPSKIATRTIGLIMFGVIVVAGILYISKNQEQYQLDFAITNTQTSQQAQIETTENEGGSGYMIPVLTPTLVGFTSSILAGLNVALFRPYIWEIKKLINIPMALESLYALCLTLYTLKRVGIFQTFRLLFTQPEALLCIIHSILISAIAGIISFNYGTLNRYRVPCFSFYLVALYIVIYEANARSRIIQ